MKKIKAFLLILTIIVAVAGALGFSKVNRVLCSGVQMYGALVQSPDISDPSDFTAPLDSLSKAEDWDCQSAQNVYCTYYRVAVPNTYPVQYSYYPCPGQPPNYILVIL